MKKKIFALLCITVIITGIFTASVSAERKLALPITLYDGEFSDKALEITSFSVTKVENLPGQYMNRIYYNINHGYTALPRELALHCNDVTGNRIGTVGITLKERATSTTGQVDVYDTTATLELASKNAGDAGESYLYVKYVNVFAEDGRILAVPDLQLPLYTMLGWSLPATVYAYENGAFSRSLNIHPSKTEAYKKVGWYTEDEVLKAVTMYAYDNGTFSRTMRVPERLVPTYREVGWYTYEDAENKNKEEALDNSVFLKIEEFKRAKRYNDALIYIEAEMAKHKGTATETKLLSCRNEIMDLWREEINSPLAVLNYVIDRNNSGTPTATISFRNISHKKISSFVVKFNCYNSYGKLEYTNYTTYSALNTNLDVAKANAWVWTLGGARNVKTLGDFRVTEVVFEDGTKWYGN